MGAMEGQDAMRESRPRKEREGGRVTTLKMFCCKVNVHVCYTRVCLYASVFLCMCTCMCVCVCVRVCSRIDACLYVRMLVRILDGRDCVCVRFHD